MLLSEVLKYHEKFLKLNNRNNEKYPMSTPFHEMVKIIDDRENKSKKRKKK